jgi:predicted nucleotidyltransferase
MLTKRIALSRAKQFLEECRQLPFEIDKAILFGSTIQGKATESSDIDLALFSKNFSDNILQNIDLIGKINIRYPEIDVHTFHSDGTKGILLDQILKTGVEIKF